MLAAAARPAARASFSITDIINLVHPEDHIKLSALLQSQTNGDEFPKNIRIRIFTSDNQLKQIETHVKAVQFKGKPALHQTFFDISSYMQ